MARPTPVRCSTGWPGPGPIGAGKAAISPPKTDARAFFDEVLHAGDARWARPISPQWFNTGLHWAYGIEGPSQGHYYVDFATGEIERLGVAYEHPQPHACFIQSVTTIW